MSTHIHLVVDIHGVLSRTDRELKSDHCKWMKRDDGTVMTPTELRVELCKMLAAGMTVVPTSCPSPLPDGRCPGHKDEP